MKATCLFMLGLNLIYCPMLLADGVREINQACVASGCFSGDSAGFPVEITNPGAYRLSSNLNTGGADTLAILINADYVDLDLHGFAVIGGESCSFNGSTVTCSLTGNYSLISLNGAHGSIHDGVVKGAFGDGLLVQGDGSLIYGLHVTQNLGSGMNFFGNGHIVRDCVSSLNVGRGFFGSHGTRFDRNASFKNALYGFQAGACSYNISTLNPYGAYACDVDSGGNAQ